MKTFLFKIPKNLHGERLDVVMVELGLPLSRRKIRKVIDIGGAYLNDKRIRIASRKVTSGDRLKIIYDEKNLTAKPKQLNWKIAASDIVYRSKELIALNKPPGLPSQATRDQSLSHAATVLATGLKQHFNDNRPLILLHRLDKETSGILLFAHEGKIAEHVTDQFRNRSIKKMYLALVRGKPVWQNKNLQCYLSKIEQNLGIVRAVKSGGKHAETDFKLSGYSAKQDVSLIICHPKTGRSHQIRKHLEMLGHPIIGDKRYSLESSKPLSKEMSTLSKEHHFLHAAAIEVIPRKDLPAISITAPLPPLFEQALKLAGLKTPPPHKK